jgi:hypothetical protein
MGFEDPIEIPSKLYCRRRERGGDDDGSCARHDGGAAGVGGELLPLPVFPYRRLGIQRNQGRGGLGYRFTV